MSTTPAEDLQARVATLEAENAALRSAPTGSGRAPRRCAGRVANCSSDTGPLPSYLLGLLLGAGVC